jgi:hypothetical protein
MSTPDPDHVERRRAQVLAQLAAFPRELARCTCGTRSFERDDHANTCPLGPNPPLSSNPTEPVTLGQPEWRF